MSELTDILEGKVPGSKYPKDLLWDGKQARRKTPKIKGKKAVKQAKRLRQELKRASNVLAVNTSDESQ